MADAASDELAEVAELAEIAELDADESAAASELALDDALVELDVAAELDVAELDDAVVPDAHPAPRSATASAATAKRLSKRFRVVRIPVLLLTYWTA